MSVLPRRQLPPRQQQSSAIHRAPKYAGIAFRPKAHQKLGDNYLLVAPAQVRQYNAVHRLALPSYFLANTSDYLHRQTKNPVVGRGVEIGGRCTARFGEAATRRLKMLAQVLSQKTFYN
jgi:hypothetical protein